MSIFHRPFAMITALVMALTLTACATNTPSTTAPTKTSQAVSPVTTTPAILAGTWQLKGIRSADKLNLVNLKGGDKRPITLNISHDTIAVKNGCNNMAANYQVANNHISTSYARSTKMMCENSLMAVDDLAGSWFGGKFMLASADVLMVVVDSQHYELHRVK